MPRRSNIIGTGLSGLVGSRIAELLGPRYAMTNLDLTTGVDITNRLHVKKAMEQASGEVVVHLAAFTDVDAAHRQKGDKNGLCYTINVLGTRHVAQYCSTHSKYLIHISTDSVFSGEKKTPYTEEDSPRPIEWYGQTKLWAEHEVEKAGGKHAILRIAFPFRAHYPQKLDLVRTIYEKLKAGTLYPMFADQLITPTFIDDITKAIDVFIQKRPLGIYHIVGSSALSPYTLAKKIAKTFDLDGKKVKKGSLAKFLKTAKRPYQKRLALSNRKAKRELGITMSTISKALRKMEGQIE